MTYHDWERVQQIFDEAIELPADERDAFVRKASDGDENLYIEVMTLLRADDDAASILDGVAADAVDSGHIAGELSRAGHVVGAYRIINHIAAGGMGAVYLAERADGQFEQRVALKLIKRGMDSDIILKRFHSERQILAHLQHANIAGLLDGGVTDDGLPYFTMEYVDGEPLTEYCDNRSLSIDERLQLFKEVCSAVQYAHRNLVIHRDLKPSNILVTKDGTVKLLDFGIAKMLDEGEEHDGLTKTGLRVMTPGYASPEQIRGEPVTTATDVYSLGVILYELLTGHRPYVLNDTSPQTLERVICSTQPDKPSKAVTRVDTSPDGKTTDADEISRCRRTQPDRLRRRLSGDVDNICLMALRKEPERRYSSAEHLRDDIDRHMRSMPVSARPDTLRYRTQKFVARNRTPLIGAGAVLGVAIALVVFYTTRLTHERDKARLEAQKAEQVSEFLIGLFEEANPFEHRGEEMTARGLLDAGSERIDKELASQPEVQAQMQMVMGEAYMMLGELEISEQLALKALATRRRLLGDDHVDVYIVLGQVGDIRADKGMYDQSEKDLREAVVGLEKTLPSDHIEVYRCRYRLANVLNNTARYDEAQGLYEQVLESSRARNDSAMMSTTMNDLGLLLHEKGDIVAAEPVLREALRLQILYFGDVHPEVSTTTYNLSQLAYAKGDTEDALVLSRQCLALDRQIFGEVHPYVAYSMNNLGLVLTRMGDYGEAEQLYRDCLAMRIELLGPEHPNVAHTMGTLQNLLLTMARFEEAMELNAQALEIHRRVQGEKHPMVAGRTRGMARILYSLGRYDEALPYARDGLALSHELLGENHVDVSLSLTTLVDILIAMGQYEEAEEHLDRALKIAASIHREDHHYYSINDAQRARIRYRQDRLAEAEQLYDAAIAQRLRNTPPDHPAIASLRVARADVYLAQGRTSEAEAAYREALEIQLQSDLPSDHPAIARSMVGIGKSLAAQGRIDAAEVMLRDGLVMYRKHLPDAHDAVADANAAYQDCLNYTTGRGSR